MGKSIIIISKLSIGYGSPIMSGIELTAAEGTFICLMGLNGCGKSTLLKTICGLEKPLAGEVSCEGSPAVVLTEKTNVGGLTVFDLVALGRYRFTDFFGRLKQDDKDAVHRAMKAVGIEGLAGKAVSQISDGERQKAFIAKALAQESQVIILDEPTAFLDVKSKIEVMQLLARLAHEEGKTILMSTHDSNAALKLADRIWLADGSGIIDGAPLELLEDGSMSRVFGESAATMLQSPNGK